MLKKRKASEVFHQTCDDLRDLGKSLERMVEMLDPLDGSDSEELLGMFGRLLRAVTSYRYGSDPDRIDVAKRIWSARRKWNRYKEQKRKRRFANTN